MKRMSYLGSLLALLLFTTFVQASDLNANKQLVIAFYQEVLLNGNAEAIDHYIGDTYIQHNPHVADGKEALKALVRSFPPKEQGAKPSGEIVRVVAEEDLVVLHVKHYSWPSSNGGAIVDIFRVEDGKIVEHWDVIQAVPDQSANQNTMF